MQLEAPFPRSFIRVSWFVLSIIALAIKQISSLHSASQSAAPLYSQKKGEIKLMYQCPKTVLSAVH